MWRQEEMPPFGEHAVLYRRKPLYMCWLHPPGAVYRRWPEMSGGPRETTTHLVVRVIRHWENELVQEIQRLPLLESICFKRFDGMSEHACNRLVAAMQDCRRLWKLELAAGCECRFLEAVAVMLKDPSCTIESVVAAEGFVCSAEAATALVDAVAASPRVRELFFPYWAAVPRIPSLRPLPHQLSTWQRQARATQGALKEKLETLERTSRTLFVVWIGELTITVLTGNFKRWRMARLRGVFRSAGLLLAIHRATLKPGGPAFFRAKASFEAARAPTADEKK